MKRENAVRVLSEHLAEIKQRFRVESLSIFGSVARDEAGLASDLDLLIDYAETPGLFGFLELKEYLEKLLGCSVDIVTINALKRQLREEILGDSIRVQ